MPTTMQGRILEDVSRNIDAETIRQPVGVCAAIVPFNFPAMVPFWFLPFAIACGNTFVLKPSEQVPMTQQIAFEEIDALGLPAGVVNLVNGGREVVEGILEHPGIDAVSFVGSAPVAKLVYERAAKAGKRVQALGGAKNHMVVMPDAVIDKTVEGIIASAFGAAGQRCMAGSVVVTVGDAHEQLLDPLTDAAAALQVGDGIDEQVRARAGDLLCTRATASPATSSARSAEGARIVLDGRGVGGVNPDGAFLGPTILDDVTPEMEIAAGGGLRSGADADPRRVARRGDRDRQRAAASATAPRSSPSPARRSAATATRSRPAWSASTSASPRRSRSSRSAAGRTASSATCTRTAPTASSSSRARRRSPAATSPRARASGSYFVES